MTQCFIRCVFTLLGMLALGLTPTVAEEAPFYWEYVHVEIELHENGDLLVTEEQKYVFTGPHTSERFRSITLDKADEITNVSVSQDGTVLSASTTQKRGTYWIRWSHRLMPPESHTFKLRYLVKGSLRVYEQTDMVQWSALFPDRDAPIQRGRVTLKLPAVLAGHLQEVASWGVSADVHHMGPRTVVFTPRAPLPPGEGLDIRVSFPHGLLQGAASSEQTRDRTGLEGVTAYLVGVVILIISAVGWMVGKGWYRFGRGEIPPVGRAEIGFGSDMGGGIGAGSNGSGDDTGG